MERKLSIETKTKTIDSLLSDIRYGNICVPPFQRDFVWERDRIKDLFDSIKRNYPIGSILMWKPAQTMNWSNNHEIGSFKLKKGTEKDWYVLDGFQRLSVLFGCLTNPDKSGLGYDEQKYNTTFNLYYDLKAEEFLYLKSSHNCQPYQIPVYVLMSSSDFRQYSRMYIENHLPQDEIDLYLDRADALSSRLLEYRIACIEISNANIEEAVDIFSRLNSKGIDISYDWMVNALSYKDGEFRFAEEISSVKKQLKLYNFGDIPRNALFRCVQSAFDKLYIDQTEIEKLSRREDFVEKTRATMPLIVRAVKFLHEELFVSKYKLLPYNTQLIFIIEFFRQLSNPTEKQLNDLKEWFWKTTYCNYFTINTLASQRKAYDQFVRYLKGDAVSIFFEDEDKLPYTTMLFPKQILLNGVRSRALVLLISQLKRTDNIAYNALQNVALFESEDYTQFVELNKTEIMRIERNFVESIGLNYAEDKLGSTTTLIDQRLKEQMKSFSMETLQGTVAFDYKQNDGKFLVGKDNYAFVTKWSECGTNSIYCYRDEVKRIGYNPFYVDFPTLEQIPSDFDFSSRCKALKEGNVAILENNAGRFVALKVLEVKKGEDDINHLVRFEYKIYQ